MIPQQTLFLTVSTIVWIMTGIATIMTTTRTTTLISTKAKGNINSRMISFQWSYQHRHKSYNYLTLFRPATISAWSTTSAFLSFHRHDSYYCHDAGGEGVKFSTKSSIHISQPSLRRSLRLFSTTEKNMDSSIIPSNQNINHLSQERVDLLSPKDEVLYKELQWLSKEVRRYDELYYSAQLQQEQDRQQQPLEDDEFDALVEREQFIAKTYPHLLQRWQNESGWGIQATRQGRVGAEVTSSKLPLLSSSLSSNMNVNVNASATTALNSTNQLRYKKRKHLSPMLSLDNVHNNDQLWAWLKRIPKILEEWESTEPTPVTIYTEPKLDGVSLSLRYQRLSSSSSSSSIDTKVANNSTQTYELQWASTRGDGQQGQDVSSAVRSMTHTIPSQFDIQGKLMEILPETLEIRGEVVLPNTQFEKLSVSTSNVTFSNPRNAASGILLRKETDVVEDLEEATQLRSRLQFFAYDLATNPPLSMDGEIVQSSLSDIGFSVPTPLVKTELKMVFNDTMEDWSDDAISPMLSYHQALQAHRNKQKPIKGYEWGDFEMDGCVHKISQFRLRRLLGRSMKSPKWAIAHKFPPKAVVTQLLDITVQIGRTGALTPVAILEPVDVGGITIQRATLHNFGHLQQMLGGVKIAQGTSVLVRRAGDVIPQVVQRIGDAEEERNAKMISLEAPTHCPACSSPIVVDELASSGSGQVMRCSGPPLLCPPRAATSLQHAFSRDALDVSGLSSARIQQLMDASFIHQPSDIFHLNAEQWEEIQDLPRWGKKSCANLQSSIENLMENGISLSRFIYSLGIRHLGKGSSELVAACYVAKDAFLTALKEAAASTISGSDNGLPIGSKAANATEIFPELQGQLGIGPVVAQSLLEHSKNKDLLNSTLQLGRVVRVLDEETIEDALSMSTLEDLESKEKFPWRGLRVVFTGSLPGYSRAQAHKLAKSLGAKATPASVSKSTDLVIYGDKGGKKLDQAKSLGIQTMSANEFESLAREFSLLDG